MYEFYVLQFNNGSYFAEDALTWFHTAELDRAFKFQSEIEALQRLARTSIPSKNISVAKFSDNVPNTFVIRNKRGLYYSLTGEVDDPNFAYQWRSSSEAEQALWEHYTPEYDEVLQLVSIQKEPTMSLPEQKPVAPAIGVKVITAAKFAISTGERSSSTMFFKDQALGEAESRNYGWYNSAGSYIEDVKVFELSLEDGTVLHFPTSAAVHIVSESKADRAEREKRVRESALSKLTLEERKLLGLE